MTPPPVDFETTMIRLSQVRVDPERAFELWLVAEDMRGRGHAVGFETLWFEGRMLHAKAHHYLSCRACENVIKGARK